MPPTCCAPLSFCATLAHFVPLYASHTTHRKATRRHINRSVMHTAASAPQLFAYAPCSGSLSTYVGIDIYMFYTYLCICECKDIRYSSDVYDCLPKERISHNLQSITLVTVRLLIAVDHPGASLPFSPFVDCGYTHEPLCIKY